MTGRMGRSSSTPPSKTVIFDVFAAYICPLGGWCAIADLVTLLDTLGVDEQIVRASVSRLTRKGLLIRASRGNQVGYRLSPSALAIVAEGDRRIFARQQPASLGDGWAVAIASVPESDRDQRYRLRSRLTRLGFGNLGGGVWLAPRRILGQAIGAVREMGLEPYVDFFEAHHRAFGGPGSLVARCWNLPDIDLLHVGFIRLAHSILARWASCPGSDRDAFIDFTTALLRWRQIPYRDPGLPMQVLPADWHGHEAARGFTELTDWLSKPARAYVESVLRKQVSVEADDMPPAAHPIGVRQEGVPILPRDLSS